MAKSGKPGAALKRSPVHLLHRALQLGLDFYAQEVGDNGVTQRQFAVLTAVAAEDGLSQTKLVRVTGIDRSTVAELVNRMTKQGLLIRQRTEADGRTNAVSLTEEGRAVLAATEPLAARADRRFVKLLGSKKGEVLVDLLKTLVKESGGPGEEVVELNSAAPKRVRKDLEVVSA